MKTQNSKTYMKWTPCGNLYITIVYKNDRKTGNKEYAIDYIRVYHSNRENNCGGSFFESLADMLTFAVRRAGEKKDKQAIIKNLIGNRCNKVVANKEHIVSCSDAIGRVLKKELL